MAALIANSAKALADVEDTEQRAATRSALGLAAERAGCREDFNTWDFSYLAEALKSKLRLEKARLPGMWVTGSSARWRWRTLRFR
eukprot:6686128-Prymnesium_polylepis.1